MRKASKMKIETVIKSTTTITTNGNSEERKIMQATKAHLKINLSNIPTEIHKIISTEIYKNIL